MRNNGATYQFPGGLNGTDNPVVKQAKRSTLPKTGLSVFIADALKNSIKIMVSPQRTVCFAV